MKLSEFGRRVLGSLPAWHEDEAWVIKQEGGPESSVRSHTLAELAAELAGNARAQQLGSGPPTADEIGEVLAQLRDAGLVEHVESKTICGIRHEDAWRMTKAGFELLTAPPPPDEDEPPGAAFIEFSPAVVTPGAKG